MDGKDLFIKRVEQDAVDWFRTQKKTQAHFERPPHAFGFYRMARPSRSASGRPDATPVARPMRSGGHAR